MIFLQFTPGKTMFFFVFVSNFFSEVVGHLGDSRVILVKAGCLAFRGG